MSKNIEICKAEEVGSQILDEQAKDSQAVQDYAHELGIPIDAPSATDPIVELPSLMNVYASKVINVFRSFVAGLQTSIANLNASIASYIAQIADMNSDIADAYDAVEDKGGTLPEQQTSANLPTAIESIPIGDPLVVDAGTGIVFYNNDRNSNQGTFTEQIKVVGGEGRKYWAYFFYGYTSNINQYPDVSEMDTRDGENFFRFYGMVSVTSEVQGARLAPKITLTNKAKNIEQMLYATVASHFDTSTWDCSGITNATNFALYNSQIASLIGLHTLQDVEDGLVAMRGLAKSLLIESSNYLRFSSMLALANGVADLTGQTQQTLKFSSRIWNNQFNDDGTTPDAATIAARQARIDAILTSKNWIRA